MSGGGDNVFAAKIAEQAERYEGKGVVLCRQLPFCFVRTSLVVVYS